MLLDVFAFYAGNTKHFGPLQKLQSEFPRHRVQVNLRTKFSLQGPHPRFIEGMAVLAQSRVLWVLWNRSSRFSGYDRVLVVKMLFSYFFPKRAHFIFIFVKLEQIWEYFFSLTLKFPGVRNFVFQTGSEIETISKKQDMICSFFIVFTTQKYFIIFEKNHRKQT